MNNFCPSELFRGKTSSQSTKKLADCNAVVLTRSARLATVITSQEETWHISIKLHSPSLFPETQALEKQRLPMKKNC